MQDCYKSLGDAIQIHGEIYNIQCFRYVIDENFYFYFYYIFLHSLSTILSISRVLTRRSIYPVM